MFNFGTAKIAPLYKFLWNLSLLPRWEVSLLWNWDGPRHSVESRRLAAWRCMASEPRLENVIQFFPGSHETTSCGALRFQVRSLKHSATRKPRARNTKITCKGPEAPKRKSKRFQGSPQQHQLPFNSTYTGSSKELPGKLFASSWHIETRGVINCCCFKPLNVGWRNMLHSIRYQNQTPAARLREEIYSEGVIQ